MAATTSNKPNLCASSYPDDLFSQFAFRGNNGSSRFRSHPSKSNQPKPTGPAEDFTRRSSALMAHHHTPISTHQAVEIPILTIEDLQEPKHEIPILTLEDLQNAKARIQPTGNPRSARTILRLYRKFGLDPKLVQKTSPLVRHSQPVQHGARKVSRFFQKSEDARNDDDENLDANVTERPSKRSMMGDCSSKRRRNDIAPSSDNRTDADQGVRIVSRFFQNSGKNHEAERKVSPSSKNSRTSQKGERVVSRFFQKSAKQEAVNNQEEGAEEAKSVKRKRKPAKERKQKSTKDSSRSRTTLSAAELFLDAYRRKSSEDTWDPPPSEIRLLQQDHAYDPWRVLVICLLLNRTTGRQAKDVIPKLFTLCPNPKAALEVSHEQIEDIIRPLGLQRKRSRTIQCLSEMYLKESWSHVTQLPGVGKYGADAHAIFCTGYWDQVLPKDHMLNYYWDFLHSVKDHL